MFKFMPEKMLYVHFEENFQILADVLETWDSFQEYAPHVAALSGNYLARIREAYGKSGAGFNVVNHGDHHPKNEMFLWDQLGKIKQICFVGISILTYLQFLDHFQFQLDFQISIFSTPAIDLLYSLYEDLSTENRTKHRDDYIMHYHTEFAKALKSYGFLKKIPTLLDLHVELLKCGFLETMLVIGLTLFGFLDWSDADPKEVEKPETSRKLKVIAYNKDRYRGLIQHELPRLFNKGLL